MLFIRYFWLLLISCLMWPAPAQASETIIASDHVRIRWLAPEQFGRDQQQRTLGIFFEVDPDWHVYWRNSGDSGAAPRFRFSGDQMRFGDLRWPYPQRLPVAHLTNLGYEGNVAYLVDMQHSSRGDTLSGAVELEWLVCKEDCIPGFGTLVLERPLVDGVDQWSDDNARLVVDFNARIPQPAEGSPWQLTGAEVTPDKSQLVVNLRGPGDTPPDVYPLDGEFVSAAEPQLLKQEQIADDQFQLSLGFNLHQGGTVPGYTGFVLADASGAWEFPSVAIAQIQVLPVAHESLWMLVLLAVVGGILLNLMPCVFPVLSIKLFSLIKSQDAPAAFRLREGFLYAAGVLSTFIFLGGVFILLRAAGTAVGWGFQLQSPWIVLGLIILFWVMALSFLGAFEFGKGIMNLAGRSGGSSSFATGVLAVFVAAPCTGPFMGAALGASATLPGVQAMAIFMGLGAGLAAPFFLLAVSPKLARLLPKPGAWMEYLRQFLAFPLFATVIWLLWVLEQLSGNQAWLVAATLLLAISFALWMGRSTKKILWVSAWIIALMSLAVSVQLIEKYSIDSRQITTDGNWQAYNEIQINQALAEGRPVFVDFTAAWCITCQVNKKLVLDTDAAQRLFAQHQVLLVRADWTRYDETITRALARFGRNSVPVYVYYPPGEVASPQLLPQLLTLADIRHLFP